jgi:hypothetical protein
MALLLSKLKPKPREHASGIVEKPGFPQVIQQVLAISLPVPLPASLGKS